MKKIIAIVLTMAVVASFAACGKKANDETADNKEQVVDTNKTEETAAPEEENAEEKKDTDRTDKTENKENESAQTAKPEAKPQESVKPAEKPQTTKPAEKPQENEKPAETPAPQASTLGKTLLAEFKTKANSGMGVQEIADALLANPAIKFSGAAMPVEEGMLAGFDNAEIKGFKNGVMFAPMIGSIAFVGYVFELDNAADAPAFISNLEKNANRRWNICVEAEETVTGSAGNKVFFVMCPKALED